MARLHILYSPASDSGSFLAVGSWLSGLPLTNIQSQQRTTVARSSDDATGSTKFVLDHGSAQSFQIFALISHNLTAAATVRIRVSNASNGSAPLLDQTVTVGADGANAGLTLYRAAAAVSGQYVLIDITDTLNPDNYVEVGRFMAGVPFVPSINMSYGAAIKVNDDTTESRTTGGQSHFGTKPKYRSLRFTLDALTDAEAFGAYPSVEDMMDTLGISGNLLAIYDPDDTAVMLPKRTIYGRLRALSEIVEANASQAPHTWASEIVELL
ncbi:MAG TPA: hypothetical protein VHL98_11175 [Microvirga sp.]|jgi:hypothetical protein|nr:hypothetical protein [Microvirga sp.]